MNNTNWEFKQYNDSIAQILSKELGTSIIMGKLLTQRGIVSTEDARRFLNPDINSLGNPFSLQGMSEAFQRIHKAVDDGEKILIYGDYDVDGVCSIVLLKECFSTMGYNVDYYVPDRFNEGYGLNKTAIQHFAADGYKLLITVDCGISSIEEVELANGLGLDVIITDHHTPGEIQPPACAIINPKNDNNETIKNLAGVGVAFKLACALGYGIIPESEQNAWLDLVALATVADIVPLIGENRILVKYGLEVLNNTKRLGLRALISKTQLDNKEIESWHIGFLLAPRLNSAGRLKSARSSVELLMCRRLEEADNLASALCQLNDERRTIEEGIYQEALKQVEQDHNLTEESIVIVGGEHWHEGVIGIVASRLSATFNRPVIVVSWEGEMGKGSARSIGDFDIYSALKECSAYLIRFGGHKMAAGLSINRIEKGAFITAMQQYSQTKYIGFKIPRRHLVDMEIGEEEIGETLYNELKQLYPFGEGNPSPYFVVRGSELYSFNFVGLKKDHLKLQTSKNRLEAIAFNQPDLVNSPLKLFKQDLLFEIDKNDFRGKQTIQLKVKDLKPSFIPDNLEVVSDHVKNIIEIIRRTINELNERRPVLYIYPGVRSISKHYDFLEYFFRSSDLHPMHGQLPLQGRKMVENTFCQNNPGIYVTTQAYWDYFCQQYNTPSELRYAVKMWPSLHDDRESTEAHLNLEIEYIRQSSNISLHNLTDWKSNDSQRAIVYANRPKTIDKLSILRSDLHIEAGITEMQARRMVRRTFYHQSAGVLVGDGTHTAGWPYLGKIDYVIMADSPFANWELTSFTDYLEGGKETKIGVSFTKGDMEKNRRFLQRMYPAPDLVQSVMPYFLSIGSNLIREDLNQLSIHISEYIQRDISSFSLLPILRVMTDLDLCQARKSGNIMEIRLINEHIQSKDFNKSPYYLEGLAEKSNLALWERDINKFMVW